MKKIKKLIRSKIGFYTSRYQQLMDIFEMERPASVIEIGVWRGDRSIEFLKHSFVNDYHGFDLFEEISKEDQENEEMGTCELVYKEDINNRLKSVGSLANIELHKGYTFNTLPEFVKKNKKKFDFIYLDGGHSLETIENDWKYSEMLLSEKGVCIFDDYYLNNTTTGCKLLIDSLDKDIWDLEFFRIVEKNVENNFNTMVALRKQPKPL